MTVTWSVQEWKSRLRSFRTRLRRSSGACPDHGEPAPWFHAATAENPNFSFDTVAGRRLMLCFFGDMQAAPLQSLLSGMQAVMAQIERSQYAFFGVGSTRDDAQAKLFKQQVLEGYLFLDRDRAVSELYGAAPIDGRDASIRVVSFVLDERLRVAEGIACITLGTC